PQGTSSTTSRKASNSFSPQNSGTALAGPLSPPGATSTPATDESAERRSFAPRSRASSPLTTVTTAGTVSAASGSPLAVTSTYSECAGGEAEGEGLGAGAARAAAGRARAEIAEARRNIPRA